MPFAYERPLCAKSSRSRSRFAYGAERTCAVELPAQIGHSRFQSGPPTKKARPMGIKGRDQSGVRAVELASFTALDIWPEEIRANKPDWQERLPCRKSRID
jgi:hypothetical protein